MNTSGGSRLREKYQELCAIRFVFEVSLHVSEDLLIVASLEQTTVFRVFMQMREVHGEIIIEQWRLQNTNEGEV